MLQFVVKHDLPNRSSWKMSVACGQSLPDNSKYTFVVQVCTSFSGRELLLTESCLGKKLQPPRHVVDRLIASGRKFHNKQIILPRRFLCGGSVRKTRERPFYYGRLRTLGVVLRNFKSSLVWSTKNPSIVALHSSLDFVSVSQNRCFSFLSFMICHFSRSPCDRLPDTHIFHPICYYVCDYVNTYRWPVHLTAFIILANRCAMSNLSNVSVISIVLLAPRTWLCTTTPFTTLWSRSPLFIDPSLLNLCRLLELINWVWKHGLRTDLIRSPLLVPIVLG